MKYALIAALAALCLAACGKRAPLRPPSDDKPKDRQARVVEPAPDIAVAIAAAAE